MKTVGIQFDEIKHVLDNLKPLRVKMEPCELRLHRPKDKDFEVKHPFLFYRQVLKDIILIGTAREIEEAEEIFL